MATSGLLYKTGMSSEGTRHLMLPGAELPLCGVEVERVFPGIGGKELEDTDYCGNCVPAAKSNETKFRKPKPTPPTPPRGDGEPLGRISEEETPAVKKTAAKKTTKKSSKKKG